MLQFRVCLVSPVQCLPPYAGGGLVQVLLRDCHPVPHALEHAHHLLQRLQPPFTTKKNQSSSKVTAEEVHFVLLMVHLPNICSHTVSSFAVTEK